jgi:hypothetical protein
MGEQPARTPRIGTVGDNAVVRRNAVENRSENDEQTTAQRQNTALFRWCGSR